jgi:hypothetical protein
MMSDYDDELDKFLKRIQDKMNDNPELKDEVSDMVERLSEIFESEIDLSIKFDLNVEDYREEYVKYEDDDFQIADEDTMTVKDLENILKDEEDLYLSIDPIYLKSGINDIKDILVTTYENKIIIVPVTEKK